MQVILKQKLFAEGLNIVKKAVDTKSTLTVLSGILLEAEDDILRLRATNLDMGIELYIHANVLEAGQVVVPANEFSNIIRELPDDRLELLVDQSNYTTEISTIMSEYTINGYNPDEFPNLPEIETAKRITFSQQGFKNLLKKVEFAISTDEHKPALNGALFLVDNGQINIIATDIYRLSCSVCQDISVKEEVEAIIPAQTVRELIKLLDDSKEKVDVLIEGNQIFFSFSGILLTSQLIAGDFPNYKYIIPNSNKAKVIINRCELLTTLQRVALVARHNQNIAKFLFKDKELFITASEGDRASVTERISIDLEGEEIEISFNVNYLIDALKVLDREEISLELIGSLSPGIIKSEAEEYLCVIMPVRG